MDFLTTKDLGEIRSAVTNLQIYIDEKAQKGLQELKDKKEKEDLKSSLAIAMPYYDSVFKCREGGGFESNNKDTTPTKTTPIKEPKARNKQEKNSSRRSSKIPEKKPISKPKLSEVKPVESKKPISAQAPVFKSLLAVKEKVIEEIEVKEKIVAAKILKKTIMNTPLLRKAPEKIKDEAVKRSIVEKLLKVDRNSSVDKNSTVEKHSTVEKKPTVIKPVNKLMTLFEASKKPVKPESPKFTQKSLKRSYSDVRDTKIKPDFNIKKRIVNKFTFIEEESSEEIISKEDKKIITTIGESLLKISKEPRVKKPHMENKATQTRFNRHSVCGVGEEACQVSEKDIIKIGKEHFDKKVIEYHDKNDPNYKLDFSLNVNSLKNSPKKNKKKGNE